MGGRAITVLPNLWNKYDVLNQDNVDAVETTYLRFNGKHVLKTNHSMFMTTILVSNKFWSTLTEKQQQAFQAAALVAGRQEREWSIEDAEHYEQTAQDRGITIEDIGDEDRAQLKHRAQITYAKCKYMFSPDLVKRIRTTLH
jgi:TRAP-type C4-dicarboxylate transport system substrate-binding protein